MKAQITGTIQSGPLIGVKCVLLKREKTGRVSVRLTEDYRAYKAGDVVNLGTGEFKADK